MNEPKVPSCKKDWKTIDIYLFSNGQQYSPPRKYHLRSEELNWWDATLGYLARSQYGSKHSLTNLYTLKGLKLDGPLRLSNGAAYVAVLPEDSFIDAGYEKYIIKASRSWEKRQSRISSGLSEQIPEEVTAIHEPVKMENTENAKIFKLNYTLDTTNTTKAVDENNVLGKTIINAKSEEKITCTLPNPLKNLGPIKLTEKRRPNSYPNQRPAIPRRPTTPSPISKVPVKTRGIPSTRLIKTIPVKSSERTGITTAQTKTLTKPKILPKTRKPETNLVESQNIAPLVIKASTPNNVGQTTELAQVENVEGTDIIVIANLDGSTESDIISTLVDADYILPAKNETQKQVLKSLDTAPKEIENKKFVLPVIEELVGANSSSEKIINTPAKMEATSFDSTDIFYQYKSVKYVSNSPSNSWDTSNNNNNNILSKNDTLKENKLTLLNNGSNYAEQQGLEMAKNTEKPIEINNTPNNNITFVEPVPLQYLSTLSNKPTEEPLLVLVNKGDIVSLKLNLEVRNAEGAVDTVFNGKNMVQPEAKNEKVSYNNNSHVSINDDGKSLNSKVGDDHHNMCCQGNHKVLIRCACCNRYQYQTETLGNDIKPMNNGAKTYFIVLPVNYGDERFNNIIPNTFEKGNQNTESLTKLNRATYINETVIVTPSSSQHNRAEHEEQIKIQAIPDPKSKEPEVSKISFVTSERNEVTKRLTKLPETKTRDSILVKHNSNISQSLRGVSEHHVIPATLIHPKKQLQVRSTQTEWHNVLMEFRRTKDGHYTFHLPPLSTLRLYKIPPFQ